MAKLYQVIVLLSFLYKLIAVKSTDAGEFATKHGKIVTCYISSMAAYRPEQSFSIADFDAGLCTHVVYAYAALDIKLSSIKPLDRWLDLREKYDSTQDLKEKHGKGNYEHLAELKQQNPHLKVSLSIGGWNESSMHFSHIASNPIERAKFVRRARGFLIKHNFDGLDLHWVYPTQRGGKPSDRENFVLLAKDLRLEFEQHKLLLTSTIAAAQSTLQQAYNIEELSKYLHYLHVKCFDDDFESLSKTIAYVAPMHVAAADAVSVVHAIEYLLTVGAPASKLVLGLPFYGRSFLTALAGHVGDATNGSSFKGSFARQDGFLGFNEICLITSDEVAGWTISYDANATQALAHLKPLVLNELAVVVTFDNTRSIASKVIYAMQMKLAGVMAWSVDTDDFMGECMLQAYSSTSKSQSFKYPLLRTINKVIDLLALHSNTNNHSNIELNTNISNELVEQGVQSLNAINISQRVGNDVSISSSSMSPWCVFALMLARILF